MRIIAYYVVNLKTGCLEKSYLISASQPESACCKDNLFPSVHLRTFTPPKKERKERGRERGRKCPTNWRGEETIVCYFFFFFFFVLAGNQALLDYVIKCIEIQVSPLSPSSILFSTVMWVQRTAAVGKKRAEGQSHFRPERTWCFEGKS